MKIKFLLIVCLMVSSTIFAKSKGQSGQFNLLTFEQYVHLSDKQKNDYHIQIMELMVELESQYKRDTRTFGYSRDRFEKYLKVVRQIEAVLIPSAHAQASGDPNQRWNAMANDFKTLSSRDKEGDGNCVFAGWISRTRGNICVHPRAEELRGTPENVAYMANDKKGCNTAQKLGKHIECNPVIFGYKKKSEGTLFCVSTDSNAENSSFECMKAALGEVVSGRGLTFDSKEERLKDLRDRYSDPANRQVFDSVFGFNMKTCICPTAPNAGFSTRYQNYIRPDLANASTDYTKKFQACYGLMNMMSKTLEECTTETNPLPESQREIFTSFRTFVSSKRGTANLGTDGHSQYKEFLTQNFLSGAPKAAYDNLCGISSPPVGNPTCEATCSTTAPAADDAKTKSNQAKNFHCTITKVTNPPAQAGGTATDVSPLTIVSVTGIPEAAPAAKTAISLTVNFQSSNKTGTASCSVNYEPPAAEKTFSCKADCTHGATAAANKCELKELKETGDAGVAVTADNGSGAFDPAAPENNARTLSYKFKLRGADKTATCEPIWKNQPPRITEKTYSCKADCTHGKTEAENACALKELKESGDAGVAVSADGGTGSFDPAAPKNKATALSYKFKLSGTDKTATCEPKWTNEPPAVVTPPAQYTCTADCTRNDAATSGDKNSCTVTLKKGEEPISGATVKDLEANTTRATNLTVEFKEGEQTKTQACEGKWNEAPKAAEGGTTVTYTCTASCKMEKNVGVCTLGSLKNNATPPADVTATDGKFDTIVALATTASYKFKVDNNEKTVACTATWPDSPTSTGPAAPGAPGAQPQMPQPGFIRRGSDFRGFGIR